MSEQFTLRSTFSLLLHAILNHTHSWIDKPGKQHDVVACRPTSDDRDVWQTYWKGLGLPWRTEPEIDVERQEVLTKCLDGSSVEVENPFEGIKLSRADIEWLLANYENGRGPVDWSDESQWEREGLDLRGADMHQVDLHGLPLARLRLGLTWQERMSGANEAVTHLEGANLEEAHLEGASLGGIHMEGINLYGAHLQEADLTWAHMKEANLNEAHLERASLGFTDLEEAELVEASLQDADLESANLNGAELTAAHLEGANLNGADFKNAFLSHAHLERTDLSRANLARALLSGAYLAEASLFDIKLSDKKHIGPQLGDVNWGNVNLSVVRWSQVNMLEEEYEAHKSMNWDGEVKDKDRRLSDYETAVRANRQLAVVLQAQGLNEHAAYFAYRAQKLQRVVLRRQRKFGQYIFSGLLDLLAGYGYKPARSIIAYLIIIFGFMGLYLLNAHFVTPHLRWDEALVLRVSSFHGRGFFTQDITLGDTYARLAAAEAVAGLLIEVSFIATFTQRYFGK